MCLILAMTGPGQRARNMGKGECYTSFGDSASSLPGTHMKLRVTRKERESERSQTFQKDFGWKNTGAVERRASANWESVRKRAD